MIVAQNSNFKQKYQSIEAREQGPPLLLKPTGVPVFTPVDTFKSINNGFDVSSTMETSNEELHQRTVRAKSFVIGKKVENQTGINLIDLENMSNAPESNLSNLNILIEPFPVKVLYVKPSHEQKLYKSRAKTAEQETVINDKENKNKQNIQFQLKEIHMKNFPITSTVQDQNKLKERPHRPKSSTSQQIKKEQIKHAKLGANANIKPQISYIRKVQSANPTKAQEKKKQQEKSQTRNKRPNQEEVLSPSRQIDVPFAENRLKGQFKNITKDLFKKAKEALQIEKQRAKQQKEEIQLKKEKQKQITEQVKKMNHELVIKQKEKGVERVDFRKKDEEIKQKLRKEELEEEKQRKKEIREKRKEESRKILGLEVLDQQKVEEYRKKVQDQLKVKEEQEQEKIKKEETRPKSANLLLKQYNKDLKQAIKDQIVEEEEEKKDPEELKKERQQILKEQKKKRKQQLLEMQKQQEEEKRRKEENLKQLELELKQQKEENLRKQEMKQRQKEEQERYEKEMEELENKKNKKKGKKIKKQKITSTHKEQLDELRNWIEEQMKKEEERDYDDQQYSEKPSKIMIKIDKKDSQQDQSITVAQNNSYISLKSVSQKSAKLSSKPLTNEVDNSQQNIDLQNVNPIKNLRFELPGNQDISYQESQKYAARQNRYGLFGDNGYSELVEIKRRSLEDEKSNKRDSSSNERNKEIRLSKEGLVTVIHKIQEYQKQKEKSNERQQNSEKKQESRTVLFEKQNVKDENFENVPGVVNIQWEIKKQKDEQQKVEREAVKIIQKWARGYLARQEVRELREERRSQIEQEYGYFEDQVKFNSDYNLKKFLKEKQTLREINKTKNVFEDSIQERIGDSSSFGRSAVNIQSAAISQSLGKPNNNVMVQNFFSQQKSDKDPLSLIEIFTKRNAPKPSVVKSPVRGESSHMDRRRQMRRGGQNSNSDIEEEIYTESFEEDEVKSHKTNGTIEEDIVESRGISSGSHSKEIRQSYMRNQTFNYQQRRQNSIQESIQEEIYMSNDRKSRRSPDRGDNSSIYEESGLNQMSASRSSLHKKESIMEESIQESIEGQSNSGSAQKFNKQLLDKQRQQTQNQISEFEKKIQADQNKRKEYISELLNEMKRYEQANVSTVVVERMEKIITQSLAQKDKILLAQRLHELELEKQHKDEINRIREEQIKLMSQLILMGGGQGNSNISDKERQQMMENIQKIIDKPIVIQQQKVVPSQSSESDKVYEEKYEDDFIEESKASRAFSRKIEESIPESIKQDKDDDDDDIVEEIIEGSESKQSQSDDEIKESVYVDGKKLQQNNKVDKELPKMRMAFGSEQAVRDQSKKTLKGEKVNQLQSNSGIFDKHSFQDFTQKKFKQMIFDDKAASEFLDEIEKTIEEKKYKEQKKLKADLNKNLISPRTFKKKEQELEKWVSKEKSELQNKKQKMAQTFDEIGTYLSKLESEKKIMLEKIGSPKMQRRLFDSQSSLEYDEIDEESNESVRVRQARKQLKNISKDINKNYVSKEDQEIQKKKATAKKLLSEKEKLIEEGLKQKVKEIESNQVDQMLNLALKLDVQSEIEKRINKARRIIEDSSEIFESARSISQSVVTTEGEKKKKNVKFASPEKYSSYDGQSSDGKTSSLHKISQNNRFEDSIGESIKIEESLSQSLPANNNYESSKKSHSNEKIKDSIRESIRESVAEDQESSQSYSEDFVSQSQLSDSKNNVYQSQNKLTQKASSIMIEDDYSANFEEESLGQSQSLLNNLATKTSQKNNNVEQVNEEDSENEQDYEEEEVMKSQNSKIKDYSQKESDSNDIQEEVIENSQSLGNSSKFQSSVPAHDEIEVLSEDKEILQSVKSIEWQFNFEQLESQRSSKRKGDDDEERYSEDFEDVEQSGRLQESKKSEKENDVDDIQDQEDADLDDLESFPDDIADSFDDFQDKADKFTDEFMELLMEEIKNNPDLSINNVVDLDEFKDKFPFNLEVEEEIKEEIKTTFKVETVIKKEEEKKKESLEDIARAKYEQDSKKQQELSKQIEQYLDSIISNINKYDLMQFLEKPLEVDPLKKLAFIFSQEQDDSLMNETNKDQTIFTLEFFKKVEDDFKRKHQKIDLTESARQSYMQHENVHHKAIFDAFNDALDLERPYRDKGQPTPWSKQTRVLKPKITLKQVEQTIQRAKDRVILWTKTNAGTRIAPPPPPPPQNQDDMQPIQQMPLQNEEERINGLREERLGMLMMKELEENENKWIDYEDEDTQVKFDLADMILEELAQELAGFMLNKNGVGYY